MGGIDMDEHDLYERRHMLLEELLSLDGHF